MTIHFISTLAFLALAIFGSALFIVFVLTFNGLIKTLYTRHHDLWLSLNCPSGWFYYPAPTTFAAGPLAAQRLLVDIAFATPEWAVGKRDLLNFIRRLHNLTACIFVIPLLMTASSFIPRCLE